MSKLNPQKASAYVGPGVLRKGGNITPVPNGPLIKKKGPFKGSTLKSGGKIKKAANGSTVTTQTTISPAQLRQNALDARQAALAARQLKDENIIKERDKRLKTSDSLKTEQRKVIWKKTYEDSDDKKKGKDFDTWYKGFDEKTKKNSADAPEPKGSRSFFAGDNGPKSPCKGGSCSGLNRNGGTVKKAKTGAMIKRADGSTSKRGLWDNIRANKGSGKKPTVAMLKQEKKIKAKK
jgi:hypothetical protein